MAERNIVLTEAEQLKKASRRSLLRNLLPVIGLIAIFLFFNIMTGGVMWSSKYLILSQVYVTLVASIGVFLVMTMGGLDFSQGSILGLASIAISYLSHYNIALAILAGIAVGAGIGAVNGFFLVKRRIPSFIVTICTMFLIRGVVKYLTSSAPIAANIHVFDYDNTAFKLGCSVALLVVVFILFRFTRFGICLKAIGSGEKAAAYQGIHTDRMKFLMYVLAGAITGFAAFLSVSKNGVATANAGNQLETQILIALVLGSMPISGGARARFSSIIVGSLFYVILKNGLVIMGLSTQGMQLIQGIVFLVFVAVFADRQARTVIK